MPRKLRSAEHSDLDLYHITSRGNKKKNIFFDEEDKGYIEFLLSDVVEKYKCKVHSYCLMDNHIHLMLEGKLEEISKVMKSILQRFSFVMNKKYKSEGHVFKNRFFSKAVNDYKYVKDLASYIHLNPVRANMVRHPEAYKWSSYNVYINTRYKKWLTKDLVLSCFNSVAELKQYTLKPIGINSGEFKKVLFDTSLLHNDKLVDRQLDNIKSRLCIEVDMERYQLLFINIAAKYFALPKLKVASYLGISLRTIDRFLKKHLKYEDSEIVIELYNQCLESV